MTDPSAPAPPLPSPPAHPSRLVFLGTPAMAVPPLQALRAAGHDVALVVTRADKRRGRRAAPAPSPVKAAAIELGLPVTDRLDDALTVGADLGVVVAYGRIIPRGVLERLPMVNLHFSLLPRWRGAAPVERAVLAGDAVTGVDLMAVEEGLDTGGIYAETRVPIGVDDTADDVRERLVRAGSDLLVQTLAAGIGAPRPQVGDATYAHKLTTEDLAIDWSRPAAEVHRLVRVGGAWTTFRGRRLKIWSAHPEDGEGSDDAAGAAPAAPGTLDRLRVATGAGWLALVSVQPEGTARQAADAWWNGARPVAGERLGS